MSAGYRSCARQGHTFTSSFSFIMAQSGHSYIHELGSSSSDDSGPNDTQPPHSASRSSLRAEIARQLTTKISKNGFDNQKYLEAQKAKIMERLEQSGEKLYVEFGGKLLFDFHAARVLPGYDPNVKIQLLQQLSANCDIILCVNAGDIERHKLRHDFGLTYDEDSMKMIDVLRNRGIQITALVITQFENQAAAISFKHKLERHNIKVYTHPKIPGYPTNVDLIVSDQGYGACEYIKTTQKLVVVTAPGPGSGKLATCLSQLYHEFRNGVNAGYSKFETFPVWNVPLKHPVNVAYEAATIDLKDSNLMDNFHKEAYGIDSVNYNRDIEAFPVLKTILERITGKESIYKSPTDMGCNCIASGIIDDAVVTEASKQEIIRRYFRTLAEYAEGKTDKESVDRAIALMDEVHVSANDRRVVPYARRSAEESKELAKGNYGIFTGSAIQLPNGDIITGHNSPQFHSAAAAIINAGKELADLPPEMHLLAPIVIDSIAEMKTNIYKSSASSLDVTEMLIALSVSTPMNPTVGRVLEKLPLLYGCEMHLSHIPTFGDANGLRKLGIQFTYDPKSSSRNLIDE